MSQKTTRSCISITYYDPITKVQSYTPATSMILNLKKKHGDKYYYYRNQALLEASTLIRDFLKESKNLKDLTFVPIPDSMCVYDYDRDSRMAEVMEHCNLDLDIQKILCFKSDSGKIHLSSSRRDAVSIKNNLSIHLPRLRLCKTKIVLLDDVLTTGAHFSACKSLILEHRPEVEVFGLMLAITR